MVAREKIMKVTGNRSYCYCEYCLVQGVWNQGLYCPMSPPTNTPLPARGGNGSGYPWTSWDCRKLPMQSNLEFRRVAAQVARTAATEKQGSKYGVKGLSVLSRLPSIDFRRSFPPDSMHLGFENIIPDLLKHWRGKYRVDTPTEHPESGTDGSEDDNESSSSEERPTKKRKTKHLKPVVSPPKATRKKGRKKNPKPAKEPKLVLTDDPYNITLKRMKVFSQEIASSGPTMPVLFGPFISRVFCLTKITMNLFRWWKPYSSPVTTLSPRTTSQKWKHGCCGLASITQEDIIGRSKGDWRHAYQFSTGCCTSLKHCAGLGLCTFTPNGLWNGSVGRSLE